MITECPKDKETETLLEYISKLEKSYPFIQPIVFFLQIQDQKTRREFLTEAKHIYEAASKCQQFAKNMQYVKTFEEERVDDILEAFEHLGIIEEENSEFSMCKAAFIAYKSRMNKSIRLVEEEVFLDIGLLDNKAILNINESELKAILREAITKAKKHLLEPESGISAQLETLKCGKKTVSEKALCHLLGDISLWATKKIEDNYSTLLEELAIFCQLLFRSRAFIFAKRGSPSDIRTIVLFETALLIQEIEIFLRKQRQSSLKEVEPDICFFEECHLFRKELQKFETESEDPSLLKPFLDRLFDKISLIPEIKTTSSTVDFDLTKLRTELYNQLEELAVRAEMSPATLPHYIPGYLAYFR